MPRVYIDPVGDAPGYYADLTTFSPGSPPPRPTPGPTPPGTEPPPVIAPPIALPPWSPPWDGGWTKPGPGKPPIPVIPGEPAVPVEPVPALVIPLPVATPPAPPPAGMPPDSKQIGIWFGPGTVVTTTWIGPIATTKPPDTTLMPMPHTA